MNEKKCVCARRRQLAEVRGRCPFHAEALIEGTFFARRAKCVSQRRFFIKKSLFSASKKEKSY